LWNIIIVYVCFMLGGNIKSIDNFLNTYGTIGTIVTVILFILGYIIYKKRHSSRKNVD